MGIFKINKSGLLSPSCNIMLSNGQLGSTNKLSWTCYTLFVRTCPLDAHFSKEPDICDPNLTPGSLYYVVKGIRKSEFTPCKEFERKHKGMVCDSLG